MDGFRLAGREELLLLVMSDGVILLIISGGFALLAALIHGVVNYRRLMRQASAVGREITSLSHAVWRQARKIVVLLLGGSVMLVGFILIFLPGPAVLVIPLGLAILAAEFTWARRWLRRLRATLHLTGKKSRRWLKKSRTATDG